MRRTQQRMEGFAATLGYVLGRLAVGISAGLSTRKERTAKVSQAMLVPAEIQPVAQTNDMPIRPVTMEQLDPIGTRLANYKPSLLRLVPFEGDWGQLSLRIFPSEMRVERWVDLHEQKLIRKAGFSRQVLPALKLSEQDLGGASLTDYAIAKSVKDVEEMLAERLESTKTPRTAKATKKTEPPAAPPAPQVEAPAATENKLPNVTPAPSKSEKLTYIGRFIGSGMGKRRRGGKESGKTFEQFYVDFADQALDFRSNRVWGTDLERAVNEAEVRPGDMIQITNLGRTPVELGDSGEGAKRAFKNCFEIRKL